VGKPVVEKTFQPPILVQRIFAGVVALAFAGRLIVEPSLRNALWFLTIGVLSIVNVLRPPGVRDGRLAAWERRHGSLVGAGAAVFAGIFAYLLLSLFLGAWQSVAFSAVLGVAYGVLVVFLGRRRQRVG
jgi:hypothetical protein